MDANELQQNLAQCCGSEHFYKHRPGNFIYTDGVKFLAENAGNGAYWLLDAIGSYQGYQSVKGEEFQVWKLTLPKPNQAILTCTDGDSDNVLVLQKIEYTDFPLPEITLYLENNTLMLPNER